MDRTGYDAVWLAEHHFTTFSVCPSVHMMGTLAAARTKRLRIGTAVSLAAFYHPLRLAEEVALLDVLSGGRVNWGAGRGFERVEFEAFGVPVEESAPRFREAVEIVLRAWTEERLSFHGTHFRFDDVEVLPKPLQQPHRRCGWRRPRSRDRLGGGARLLDPDGPALLAWRDRPQAALLAERLAAAGFSIEGRDIPIARLLALGDTEAEAEAVARRGAQWMVDSYPGRSTSGRRHGPDRAGSDPVQHYIDGVILHGTPEAVVDKILRLREEIGLDYLMCAPLSHHSFMLLTEKVVPLLP